MADLGKAYVQIVPSARGISSSISKELNGASASAGQSSGLSLGGNLLSGLKKVFAAAAVGKIIKDAFEAGGNLQQSFGGLETIYGDAAEGAKQYAFEAAQAGISANSYAEQAVSFGAALKQAFGGDTEAAMEAANTAIMDMADNSAKMGTDIGSIQAAYQGFAKQNYTMLDNLKLGYGGTKTEMERLLSDAEKLTGVKYDINNLGDVYNAIHAVQGELGLTGVAAGEAETTLTGSFGAMKASWTNLLAAMTTGNGLDTAMANLGKSAGNVLKNVARMAGNIVTQLPTLFSGLITTIGPALLPAATGLIQGLLTEITTQLPMLLTGGMDMLLTIVQGIMQALPQLITTAATFIPTLLMGIVQALPQLITTGFTILTTLMTGIVQALPQLLSGGLQAAMQFITGVVQNLPTILETGVSLLGKLAAGAVSAIPQLIGMIPEMFTQFTTAFAAIDWSSLGLEIINGIIRGIDAGATALWNSLRDLAAEALQSAKEFLKIESPSKVFADEVGAMIPAGITLGIDENTEPVNASIVRLADSTTAQFERAASPGNAWTGYAPQRESIDYARLAEAISSRPVVIQGDTAKIFRVVRSTNTVRTRATNYNALGAMT